jgi:hypothetical protein
LKTGMVPELVLLNVLHPFAEHSDTGVARCPQLLGTQC